MSHRKNIQRLTFRAFTLYIEGGASPFAGKGEGKNRNELANVKRLLIPNLKDEFLLCVQDTKGKQSELLLFANITFSKFPWSQTFGVLNACNHLLHGPGTCVRTEQRFSLTKA